MKASTQIWLAAALLQQERGPEADFPVDEVVSRATAEHWNGVGISTLRTHASSHCVASRPPNPGRYRMLTRTAHGRVRLFRRGDPYDPGREDGPVTPDPRDVPPDLRTLLDWYENDFATGSGLGNIAREIMEWSRAQGIWKGIDPDEYVRQLREGWD